MILPETKKTRTPKQILASYLQRKDYKNCRGQVSDHGLGTQSIQIFCDDDVDADRFPYARKTSAGSYLVADFAI